MSETKLVGGSAADRKRVLERMEEYLLANAEFDWEKLPGLWSDAPEAVFFNMNGHTYNGIEHWTQLWKYYRERASSGYWTPFDIGGVVSDELAVIWSHRHTKSGWTSSEPRPAGRHQDRDHFLSRATMVLRKESGDWRVVHVHFSEASESPRPGGI